MPNLNKVLIMGTLTRDPELKYTPKGTAIVELGMAINRTYTTDNGEKREEVVFVDITFWGKTAEVIGEYCKKGKPLFVEGRLQLDTWDDKESGKKRSKLKIVGDNFQFLGGKSESSDTKEERPQKQPASQQPKPPNLDAAGDAPF